MPIKKTILVEKLSVYRLFRLSLSQTQDRWVVVGSLSSLAEKLIKKGAFKLSYIPLSEADEMTPITFEVINRSLADVASSIFNRHEERFKNIFSTLCFEEAKKIEYEKLSIICKRYLTSALSKHKPIIEFTLSQLKSGASLDVYSESLQFLRPYLNLPNSVPLKIRYQLPSLMKIIEFFLYHKDKIKSILRNITIKPTMGKAAPELLEEPDIRPLYFPHKGVSYGGIFDKELYYSDSHGSKAYIHIETEENINPDTIKSYVEKGIEYEVLPEVGLAKRDFICLIKNTLKGKVSLSMRFFLFGFEGLLRSNGRKYSLFTKNKSNHMKVAISGYPELFDPLLSSILQANGFFVLGVQERAALSFYLDYSFLIFDKYICEGKYTENNLCKNRLSKIDLFQYMRPYRIDWITSNNQDDFVLCFDFHTDCDIQENWNPIVSIKNNLIFYKDILDLADKYPLKTFIIKSKDSGWEGMRCYQEIMSRIERTPNVKTVGPKDNVDTYSLISRSSLVLGKHTSALDEAAIYGKSTLIHDYGCNYKNLFKSALVGLHDSHLFCESNQDLLEKVENSFSVVRENGLKEVRKTTKERVSEVVDDLFENKRAVPS